MMPSVARIGTPQNQRSRDTRAAMLDAAWELLERAGDSEVTMAAVAEAAGVSRQAVYLHFPSRGQLFMAVMDHVDEALDLHSSLRPVWEAADSLTALDAFADHIARYHSRLIGVVRAVDRSRHGDDDAAALWARSTELWYGGCRSVTDALAAEGHLADPWTPTTAADLMWALMSIEFVDDLTGERSWTPDELATRLRVLFRRTLCNATED